MWYIGTSTAIAKEMGRASEGEADMCSVRGNGIRQRLRRESMVGGCARCLCRRAQGISSHLTDHSLQGSVGEKTPGIDLKLSNGDEGEILMKSPLMFSK